MAYKIKKHTIVVKYNINNKPIKVRHYYTIVETFLGITLCYVNMLRGELLGHEEIEVTLESYQSLATHFTYDEACILLRIIEKEPDRVILMKEI